jgi:hypothetical protein
MLIFQWVCVYLKIWKGKFFTLSARTFTALSKKRKWRQTEILKLPDRTLKKIFFPDTGVKVARHIVGFITCIC